MQDFRDIDRKIISEVIKAKRIVIIAHRAPDADAFGAACTLLEWLHKSGKQCFIASIDPAPKNSLHLFGAQKSQLDFPLKQIDLIISVDCSSKSQVGFFEKKPRLQNSKVTFINIDHHIGNERFGTLNLVCENEPSTCSIIHAFLERNNFKISPSMATSLLHGIIYDTGAFMHDNVKPSTLRAAARLMKLGADRAASIKKIFKSASITQLRLWGLALSRLTRNPFDGVSTVISKSDYKALGSNPEELTGLVSYLAHVKGSRFGLLLADTLKGQVKGSLRTQENDVNLNEMAKYFGGGGHKKAAGFTISGHLEEKRSWVIKE